MHEGWGRGGGTLYPRVECPPLPQVNSDCSKGGDMRNCFQHPLEGHSETSNDQALLNPFYHYIKMKAYMRVGGGGTLPWGRLSPPHYHRQILTMSIGHSPAIGDTLTQATVSHPTDQPRGTLWPRLQCHPTTTELRGMLQPRLHCPTKLRCTLTQAAAVQLRGTL